MRIDAVILWVDGSDPKWLEERNTYLSDKVDKQAVNTARFRDWGILKYWFRSIEKYAPWINKIHFVTYGHLPDFLIEENNDKLNIVNHKDFIPMEYLPVYNSAVIELNLHRIEGLADRFLLFNDDLFLTKSVKPTDFFDIKTGYPKMEFHEIPVRFVGKVNPWQTYVSTAVGIVNKNFKKRDISLKRYLGKYISFKYGLKINLRNLFSKLLYSEYYTGFKNYHGIACLLKDTFNEVWISEKNLLEETCSHRFRENFDVNPWTLLWWQLAKGTFVAKKNQHLYFEITENTIESICEVIRNKTVESICINDSESIEDITVLRDKLISVFEEVFPEKSSFEK